MSTSTIQRGRHAPPPGVRDARDRTRLRDALAALSSEGVEDRRLTVEAVCRRAKISKATFYRLWPDLDAMRGEVVDYLAANGGDGFGSYMPGDANAAARAVRAAAAGAGVLLTPNQARGVADELAARSHVRTFQV